jgi:hypothetical protein
MSRTATARRAEVVIQCERYCSPFTQATQRVALQSTPAASASVTGRAVQQLEIISNDIPASAEAKLESIASVGPATTSERMTSL